MHSNHNNNKRMITRNLKWTMGILAVTMVLASCKKKLLDVYPSGSLSDVTVFQDISLVNRFLNDIYGTLPNGFNRRDQNPADAGWSRGMSAFAMAEDDAEANNNASSTQGINQGTLPTTWAYADDIWTQNYAVIRKCNVLIQNIDDVPADDDIKKRMKG